MTIKKSRQVPFALFAVPRSIQIARNLSLATMSHCAAPVRWMSLLSARNSATIGHFLRVTSKWTRFSRCEVFSFLLHALRLRSNRSPALAFFLLLRTHSIDLSKPPTITLIKASHTSANPIRISAPKQTQLSWIQFEVVSRLKVEQGRGCSQLFLVLRHFVWADL